MTRRPRLVALDVDGCLLQWTPGTVKAEERVRPAVRQAVRRVVAAGVPVVLASGRSGLGLADVAGLLGLPSAGTGRLWFVASNGAVLCRHPPLEVVRATTFDASDAVAAVLRRLPDARLAVEDARSGYRVTADFPRGELSGRVARVRPEELGAHEATRVIVRRPERHDPGGLDALAAELGRAGVAGTGYVVGLTDWLDLSPAGVTKASGLATVAEELGVARAEVLAIGDGANDIEMLTWAGRGVAMGQADAEVRAAADATTLPVDEDGVAAELDRWFGPDPTAGRG
ncbi:HAD family hydrolase [Nocardioides donggukensis]|uniref:HAD family hydrolase n=1 Tax=Nocardioides donggukensis TaxID=2774019 RepID=UPI00191F02F1|nr:HAD family hydrolase [Nocardioides donggukensis]